jgi:hypothetical protein
MSDIRALGHQAFANVMIICLAAKLVERGDVSPLEVGDWLGLAVEMLSRVGQPGGPPLSFVVTEAERADFTGAVREAAEGAAATFRYVLAGAGPG